MRSGQQRHEPIKHRLARSVPDARAIGDSLVARGYALGGTAATIGAGGGVGPGAALYAAVGVALRVAQRGRTSVVA
jgi:hypothetical protein